MDFGFSVDPDSLTEVAIDKRKRKIYLKEHIYKNGIKSNELAKIILDKVDNKLIIADSAEPRLIADLRHLGVNIKPVKKGTIESGITRMQDYELVITPESTNIAKELNYIFIDSGAMYRAVTLYLLRNNISLQEVEQDPALLGNIKISFEYDAEREFFLTTLNGENIEKRK